MSGRRWSAADETLLLRERRRLTVPELARRLGRSERAIITYSYLHRCYPWDGSWYTPIEVARLLGVSRQYVTRLCAAKRIRARRVPGMRRWLIDPDDVERLVRERRPELWTCWRGGCR